LFILHVVRRSLVRGTPGRIARYWGTHTAHRGAALCLERAGGWQFKEALNPYGYMCARDRPGEIADLLAKADVIHCHDDGYPTMLPGAIGSRRPLVHHAHIGDLPQRMFRALGYRPDVKHACITNGYGRLFDAEECRARVRFGRLADPIEIEHPIYRAGADRPATGPLRVVYTFSNRAEVGRKINAKSPGATKALVQGLEGVDFHWVNGVGFERSMAEKRWAHVVLDEVFTPYTNLSSLEGAAAGACVVVNFDDYTRNDLCDWLGAPRDSYPFLRVTPETLRGTLEALRDDPREAIERGRAARAWMEKWYGTRRILDRYLEFYAS
jgi:hypothetical protein